MTPKFCKQSPEGFSWSKRRFIKMSGLFTAEIKHLLGSAKEAHTMTQEITAHSKTFADDIINEEAEKSFPQVMAILYGAAA